MDDVYGVGLAVGTDAVARHLGARAVEGGPATAHRRSNHLRRAIGLTAGSHARQREQHGDQRGPEPPRGGHEPEHDNRPEYTENPPAHPTGAVTSPRPPPTLFASRGTPR